MDAPPKENWSLKYQLSDGSVRSFPTLDDYIKFFVNKNLIRNENDLIKSRPELIADIQNHWIAKARQVGCIFAYKLVNSTETNHCYDKVFLDVDNADSIELLTNVIHEMSNHAEAIHIILPTLKTPDKLCKFLNLLCRDNSWVLQLIENQKNDKPNIIKVGLRLLLSNVNYMSWALGFAPFNTMPITRKAPFTSIIFRTKGPGRCPEIMSQPRLKDNELNIEVVHLADLPDGLPGEDNVCKIWAATQTEKKLLIDGTGMHNYAKVKVTFSLPNNLSKEIQNIIT